jgi:hypothetical protein
MGRGRLEAHACAFDAGKRSIDIPNGVISKLGIAIDRKDSQVFPRWGTRLA